MHHLKMLVCACAATLLLSGCGMGPHQDDSNWLNYSPHVTASLDVSKCGPFRRAQGLC